MNDTVYLKIDAKDLPSASFTRVQDLSPGTEVWAELLPGELQPLVILNLNARLAPTDSVSSEIAVRRILLSGTTAAGQRGGAVWDDAGLLVGIVESAPGEAMRLVPASGIDSSFSSLLFDSQIKHAVLGVRTVDLADVHLGGDRGGLPQQGALVHDDRKSGKPGVAPNSPAAKAKLKSGDVILKVEHDILDGSADLGEILAAYRPGTAVTLRVLSSSTDSDVSVTLGSAVTSEPLK